MAIWEGGTANQTLMSECQNKVLLFVTTFFVYAPCVEKLKKNCVYLNCNQHKLCIMMGWYCNLQIIKKIIIIKFTKNKFKLPLSFIIDPTPYASISSYFHAAKYMVSNSMRNIPIHPCMVTQQKKKLVWRGF